MMEQLPFENRCSCKTAERLLQKQSPWFQEKKAVLAGLSPDEGCYEITVLWSFLVLRAPDSEHIAYHTPTQLV